MKTRFHKLLAATACAAMSISGIAAATAQQEGEVEVIILNQDGEEVQGVIGGSVQILEGDTAVQDIEINRVVQGNAVEIQGDRIVITDADGQTQEIDISDAQSVSVSQSIQSVNDNGEQRNVRSGSAVIIDAEGQRHVIPLGEGVGAGDFEFEALDVQMVPMMEDIEAIMPFIINEHEMPEGIAGLNIFEGLPGHITAQMGGGGYRIGVMCEPVNEQLRAHLDIDPDVGLVINSVTDGPAMAAGVQKHDVLLYADDTELKTLEDLTGVIQRAGKEEQSISITALRNGGEVSFDITPQESPANEAGIIFQGGIPMNLEVQRIGPGIIIGGEGAMPGFEGFDEAFDGGVEMRERMQLQMQQMQEQHERMMEQHRRMMEEFERFNDDSGNGG
ncbi:MAG: PDZ domain-containing protein [Planctomycetota bacterium]